MLDFKIPEINDYFWVSECLSEAHSMNCEYTFGSIYLWHTAYRTKIAHYKDFFICRWGKEGDFSYSLPIGKGNFKEAVLEIIADAKENCVTPNIYGVTESYKEMLKKNSRIRSTINTMMAIMIIFTAPKVLQIFRVKNIIQNEII